MQKVEFHQQVDKLWNEVEAQLDKQLDVDIEIEGSVFTIILENGAQIVLNKQEPLSELWIASTFGAYHCYFENNQWVSTKGPTFKQLLLEALQANGFEVDLDI